MLEPLQGRSPGLFQLIATYGLFAAAAGLTLAHAGTHWSALLLAIIAGDWAGGVVANAAEPTRAWWRGRTGLRRAFLLVHLAEIPLVWWLTGGDIHLFVLLLLVLFAKLSVFLLGREAPG